MRESHICPKCNHNHILFVAQVADQGDHFAAPAMIAMVPVGKMLFSDRDRTSYAGLLCAFVCRQCGYCEHYVRDPQDIPIDGRYVSELVGPETEGPYR
ncbi:MAG: hypothetical protein QM831_00240 [Kofleriaceae bacterium]